MTTDRMKRLQAAGWKAGSAGSFLGLTEQEIALVDLKLALVDAVRAARLRHGLSQTELAQRMRSSQSRIAKIETGDPTVSLDLIVRAFLATGASRRELQRALGAAA